jgi:hypothetical protein
VGSRRRRYRTGSAGAGGAPRPAHPAVPGRHDFVEAAPALPGDPRIRLPPAPARCCDSKPMDGLSPPYGQTAPRGAHTKATQVRGLAKINTPITRTTVLGAAVTEFVDRAAKVRRTRRQPTSLRHRTRPSAKGMDKRARAWSSSGSGPAPASGSAEYVYGGYHRVRAAGRAGDAISPAHGACQARSRPARTAVAAPAGRGLASQPPG